MSCLGLLLLNYICQTVIDEILVYDLYTFNRIYPETKSSGLAIVVWEAFSFLNITPCSYVGNQYSVLTLTHKRVLVDANVSSSKV